MTVAWRENARLLLHSSIMTNTDESFLAGKEQNIRGPLLSHSCPPKKNSENYMMVVVRVYKVRDHSDIIVALTRKQTWTYTEEQDKGI